MLATNFKNIILISLISFFILIFINQNEFVLLVSALSYILIWSIIFLDNKKQKS